MLQVLLLLVGTTALACSNATPVEPSAVTGGQNPVSPTCVFTIADDQRQRDVDAAGTAFTVSVAASRPDCAWTVVSSATFVTSNRESAQGSAAVDVLVAPNGGDARSGQIQVAGHAVVVTQRAAAPVTACGATVGQTRLAFSEAGGTADIAVTGAAKLCSWTASTDASFLRITSTVPREGDGTVTIGAQPNDGPERTGVLSIAGTLVTVTQAASSICVRNVTVTPSQLAAVGGGASVDVIADDGCSWEVTSGEGFVTVASPGTGRGNGSAGLSVAANTSGGDRAATLSVGGRRVTVTQVAASSPLPPPPTTPPPAPPTPTPPTPAPPPALPAPGSGAESMFSFTSDPGDYVGRGSSLRYTSSTARIEAYAEEHGRSVFASIMTGVGQSSWNVRIAAPGGQRLSPGEYTGAARSGFFSGATPGLDVSGDGRGCNTTTGRFAVHSASVAPNGTLLKIHVTFEQHCEGAGPALRGEFVFIRPPSALPPPTSSPSSSFVSYVSDSGDYIGGGQSATWTSATSTIAATTLAWGLELTVTPMGSPFPRWNIGMAVDGQVPGVGLFESAARYPFPSTGPSFSFYGDGRGCNELLATFQVHQLVRDAGGVALLQVTFEQHCEKQTPALRGEIVYIRP